MYVFPQAWTYRGKSSSNARNKIYSDPSRRHEKAVTQPRPASSFSRRRLGLSILRRPRPLPTIPALPRSKNSQCRLLAPRTPSSGAGRPDAIEWHQNSYRQQSFLHRHAIRQRVEPQNATLYYPAHHAKRPLAPPPPGSEKTPHRANFLKFTIPEESVYRLFPTNGATSEGRNLRETLNGRPAPKKLPLFYLVPRRQRLTPFSVHGSKYKRRAAASKARSIFPTLQ